MKYKIILILLAFLLQTCRHSEIVPPSVSPYDKYSTPFVEEEMPVANCQCHTPCDNIPYPNEKYHYSYPRFNPNNPYEIAFVRNAISGSKMELCIFNFETGRLRVLTEGTAFGFDWGRKGRLVYIIGNTLYTVNADGSDLKQFRRGYLVEQVKYNYTADKFIYAVRDGYEITDENGNVLDRFPFSIFGTDLTVLNIPFILNWTQDDKLVAGNKFYDYSNRSLTVADIPIDVKKICLPAGVNHLTKEHFFSNAGSLWKIHTQTGAAVKLLSVKKGNSIGISDMSSTTQKLLLSRGIDLSHNTFLYSCEKSRLNFLTIMDTDGTNERRLRIPE